MENLFPTRTIDIHTHNLLSPLRVDKGHFCCYQGMVFCGLAGHYCLQRCVPLAVLFAMLCCLFRGFGFVLVGLCCGGYM
ncbi:hypothetical protein Q3G72_012227 [Acer saccharum]|nr:hypothetical protein Q3G72_012227 [Acer saccharum]